MTPLPRCVMAVLALALLASPMVAHASDSAAAQALFDEAKALMKAGKYADACPKFAESNRLDPAPGTEFNLADCDEHAGRTASAWAEFTSVADSLRAVGQRDRERIARDRAIALGPRLTRLSIRVPSNARAPGLEVMRDAEVLREAQWGSEVPVDPGRHTISVSAPGMQTWQQATDVAGEGKTVVVEVPRLVSSPAAQAPATTPTAPASADNAPSTQTQAPGDTGVPVESPPHLLGAKRIVALIAGGVGVVGVGLGSYFGAQALSKHSAYEPHCPNNACDPTGISLHSDAVSAATISTVAMSVGAVALVGGVVLWLTAPSRPASTPGTSLRAAPTVGAHSGGLVLEGTW